MKLPNAEQAQVPELKITRYLLHPGHPAGGSKAVFFLSFGFTADSWRLLAAALLQHAREHEVAAVATSPYGTRYAVDGPLPAPSGDILNVRSTWFIDAGGSIPRFVTAHPLPRL